MAQEEAATAVELNGGNKPVQKKAKPTKVLPTDRINFKRQLELLRGYAIASGPQNKPVTQKEIAAIVQMSETTPYLANAFFLDIGLLIRVDGGLLIPSEEVRAFQVAFQWNAETAAHKLRPLFANSWFANAIVPSATLHPLSETEALARLADMSSAGPQYRTGLKTLLEYLEAVGLIVKDGDQIKAASTHAAQVTTVPAQPERTQNPPTPEPKEFKAAISTAFNQGPEGIVQFHVSIKVNMAELSGWKPERIASFFAGIAQVLAAKGAVEQEAGTE
jgi:hypothetical protein